MAEEKKKSIFDEIYDRTDETIKKIKKPLVQRQMKGKMRSAYDSAENKKIDAETKLQDLRSDFENFDVNDVLEQRQIINESKRLQKMIVVEYKELFGQDMPKDE